MPKSKCPHNPQSSYPEASKTSTSPSCPPGAMLSVIIQVSGFRQLSALDSHIITFRLILWTIDKQINLLYCPIVTCLPPNNSTYVNSPERDVTLWGGYILYLTVQLRSARYKECSIVMLHQYQQQCKETNIVSIQTSKKFLASFSVSISSLFKISSYSYITS